MKICILGSQSDIAKSLRLMLEKDGHDVWGWCRGERLVLGSWNLIISSIGTVVPVGAWQVTKDWDKCFDSNLLLTVKILQELWAWRLSNASVCFMAGSNPQKIMPGYAAYNASKMALLKVVEQLDVESPEKFFALGPGYMDTKIHKPTLDANWPNERIAKGNPTKIEKVYDCLKWCISQPKEVVGGRNICVSDPYGPELAERLKANPNLYKLRRVE